MARGFLDDDEIAAINGGSLDGFERFDAIEKSIEFIKRAELVQSEISLLQDDLKEIWNECRDYGLDPAVLKKVMARRRKSKHENEAEDIAVGNIELRLEGRNEAGEEIDDDYEPYVPPPDSEFDIF